MFRRSFLLASLPASLFVLVACGSEDVSTFPDTKPEPAVVDNSIPPPVLIESTPPASCQSAESVTAAAPETPDVLFVVDRSGSMKIKLSNGSTRWSSTTKALADLLGSLKSNVRAGATMFPQGDKPVTCCAIAPDINDTRCNCAAGVLPGTTNRCDASKYNIPIATEALDSQQTSDILSYVHTADNEFYWGTPLEDGLRHAVEAQKANKAGAKSIVFLTDGVPTSCDTSSDPNANAIERTIAVAADGAKAGIRTFVLGVIDGNKGARADHLSPIAKAGGTARFAGCEGKNECFHAINAGTFAQDIKAAFDQVAVQAFDCSFRVPTNSTNTKIDASRMAVQVVTPDGKVLNVLRDKGHTEGWDFLPGETQIQLYGPSCTMMRNASGAQTKIFLGCEKTQIN